MITTPQYGMPLGTGAMGSLVWNNNTSSLNFQINRVDVFGYNSAATGVDGSSDYGYGIAYLNVNLGGSPFSSTTSQHLSLYDGKLTVAGTGVSVDVMGDTRSDVFALKISDTRSSPQPITVDLAMLQNPDVTSGTHVATTRTSDSGGQIRLQETYTKPAVSGYTQDDHYCSAAVVADVSGRTGTVSYPDSKTVRLTLPATAGTAYVYVGSHASLNSSDNVVTLATNKVNTAKSSGFDTIYSNNQTWWQNYWFKSYETPEDFV